MSKKLKKIVIYTFVFIVFLFIFSNLIIIRSSKDKIINQENVSFLDSDIKIGMVLGTSKYSSDLEENIFYKYRIDTAEKLYKSGKIKYLILSGQGLYENYNEVAWMKNDLVERGVPESAMIEDFLGTRTLKSVKRFKNFFEGKKVVIVSQKFHLQRAIFIAKNYNIDAYGLSTESVSFKNGFKTYVREAFSRVKVFLDVLLNF